MIKSDSIERVRIFAERKPEQPRHKEEYRLWSDPITYAEFLNKINYRFYLDLMDVPKTKSVMFHIYAENKNVNAAMETIEPYLRERGAGLIKRHLANTVMRVE